ncbi:MAG: hypothetical protein LBN19_02825 [Endomicrobium sp.]|nr:hypothetical protein [Endomicrobium sp.]
MNEIKRDDNSILIDYPDDFIRKMRLTGLISIRGGGHFIDLNTKENNVIDYILQQYIYCKEFRTEKEFFSYIGQIDNNLISKLSIYNVSAKVKKTELKKWVDYYDWILIKEELLNLFNKKASKDEILKVIEQPLRLEFLISLAILKKLKNVTVKRILFQMIKGFLQVLLLVAILILSVLRIMIRFWWK